MAEEQPSSSPAIAAESDGAAVSPDGEAAPKKRTRRGTRGGRGRSKPASEAAATAVAEASEVVPELADVVESVNGTADAPKKKTRRGTRGGRNRKKPTTTPADSVDTVTEPVAAETDAG